MKRKRYTLQEIAKFYDECPQGMEVVEERIYSFTLKRFETVHLYYISENEDFVNTK